MKKQILVIMCIVLLSLTFVSAKDVTWYGKNESSGDFIPILLKADGTLKTDINLLNVSVGNLFVLNNVTADWGFYDSINVSTLIVGNANIEDTYVPYTGATKNVDLGVYDLTATDVNATNIKVDHITERTGGHNVVFDENLDLGGSDIIFTKGTIEGNVDNGLYFTDNSNYIFQWNGGQLYAPFQPVRNLGRSADPWTTAYITTLDLGTNTITDGNLNGNWAVSGLLTATWNGSSDYYLNSNPYTFWNDTYATFNKTYADTIYSSITEPLWSANFTAHNDTWSSTFNATYDAKYGNGDNISVENITAQNITAFKLFLNDWTNVSITESQISDLTHTTDTNASTSCSGNTTYLSGEGSCNDIDNTYAKYQFTNINFNGSGDFTTNDGTVTGNTIQALVGGLKGTLFYDDARFPNHLLTNGDNWTTTNDCSTPGEKIQCVCNDEVGFANPNPDLEVEPNMLYGIKIGLENPEGNLYKITMGGATFVNDGSANGNQEYFATTTNTNDLSIEIDFGDLRCPTFLNITYVNITAYPELTAGEIIGLKISTTGCTTGSKTLCSGTGLTAGDFSAIVGTNINCGGDNNLCSGGEHSVTGATDNIIVTGSGNTVNGDGASTLGQSLYNLGGSAFVTGVLGNNSAPWVAMFGLRTKTTSTSGGTLIGGLDTYSQSFFNLVWGDNEDSQNYTNFNASGGNVLLFGRATNGGIGHVARGQGDIVMGEDLRAEQDYITMFGRNYTNNISNSISWGQDGKTAFFVTKDDAYFNVTNALTIYNDTGFGHLIAGEFEVATPDLRSMNLEDRVKPTNILDMIDSSGHGVGREYLLDVEKSVSEMTDYSRAEYREICQMQVSVNETTLEFSYERVCKMSPYYPYKIKINTTLTASVGMVNKIDIMNNTLSIDSLIQEIESLKSFQQDICKEENARYNRYDWCDLQVAQF